MFKNRLHFYAYNKESFINITFENSVKMYNFGVNKYIYFV